MKALLLAAGAGTRLRPLTDDRPKPMVPLEGQPLIGYTLSWLARQGIRDVAINLHYKPDPLVQFVGDGARHAVRVRYSSEAQLLGSAGALVPLSDYFRGSPFVVVYGDVLTDLELRPVAEQHGADGAAVTVVLTTVEDPARCGVVAFDRERRVTRFEEKPAPERVFSRWVNAGVYVCAPEVLDYLPEPCPVPYDFGHDLFPLLLRRGARVGAYPSEATVVDIGSVERLEEAGRMVRGGWLGGAGVAAC